LDALRENWGETVTTIQRLKCSEAVRLDQSQLEVLYQSLGAVGADKVVNHALEELASSLMRVGTQYRSGETDELRTSIRGVIAAAQQVGMTLLARVGRDVLELSQGYDATAFAATMARLERIGESSLVAVWELQDMSI
jgi:hypothetical protein